MKIFDKARDMFTIILQFYAKEVILVKVHHYALFYKWKEIQAHIEEE